MDKYIDLKNRIDIKKLKEVANEIREGKIVVFPTETVYGIGTNGLNTNSVKRLFEIRKRPIDKPISLLVSDMDMVEKLTKNITNVEYKIMEHFFPGPLTIILKKSSIVPNIITSNSEYVGIRMPQGEIARELVNLAGVPIAAPSANISGKPSGTILQDIMKDFKNTADFFLDGGESKFKIASTIVKVVNENPTILREGSITLEQIKQAIY